MMDMKEEVKNLIKVCVLAYICLGYSYFLGKIVPKGLPRLVLILPVSFIFLSIPLYLKSVHFIGAVSLYISWLANFKLLLFALGKGPLSTTPSMPLPRFLAIAFFPIKKGPKQEKNLSQNSLFNYGVKGILLAIFLRSYLLYKDNLDPMVAWFFCGNSIYFGLELIVGLSSKAAVFLLGLELESPFNEPYLSTSLQDFWGRRWNVMVNRILHPTTYEPVQKSSARFVGRKLASILAILATFVVSGLMHELIFFYFTRARPNWDVMLFFCLHGVCLAAEIIIKREIKVKRRLPQIVIAPLVVAFVFLTSYWLFRPAMLRCKMFERAAEDYKAVKALAKQVIK